MKTSNTIGITLILGALGVMIPYTILTFVFDYPSILREDPGLILTEFHNGGSQLIWTWWTFAILGLPLVLAYSLIGKQLEEKLDFVRWATNLGIIGLVAQMIGLLRWTFVVPILAKNYVSGNEMAREISKSSFQLLHQYGGVLLGEHIGQLFTIVWTIAMAYAFRKLRLLPNWVVWLGYLSSGIYLLAQMELFATVLPGIFVIGLAGFIGSTLWIAWLIVVGVYMMRVKQD